MTPLDLTMRLLKSPLDLLSADELFELSALGTDDPELVERHLGEYRTLTPEEAEDISFRAVDAQITEGDASHPEGMSHEENVKQFRGRGGRPVNWGFNVGTRFGRGDEEGETHWEKSPPTIGPPPVNEPIFIPPGPKSPEIIANLAWPMGFTTENKGEPMDIAWRLLKVDDEIPDFSDEPVDQCEMCNKYLHDSDYHVLNDHNYCSDCYNQLAEPEEFDYDFQDKLTGEPMEIAFQMLKAPYLPESFTPTQDEFQMPNQPDWAQGAQGVFGHPEMPQVQYPMSISYMGKNPYVEVKDPASGETIAHGTFRYEPHPYDEEEPGHFVSDDTWVHEDHRGKRIGPSMYNFLVNQMERLQGPEVKGSEHMTKPGERMWLREQGTAEPGTPWRRTI